MTTILIFWGDGGMKEKKVLRNAWFGKKLWIGLLRGWGRCLKATLQTQVPLTSMGGWAEGLACADPWTRTPNICSVPFLVICRPLRHWLTDWQNGYIVCIHILKCSFIVCFILTLIKPLLVSRWGFLKQKYIVSFNSFYRLSFNSFILTF